MTTSAREASSRLAALLRREHDALAEFLVALSEFDRARGWVELGYASLFDYLHRHLALSKGAAFYRMTAARLIQDHPQVLEPLRDGRLCLTSVVSLSKAVAAGRVDDVLPRFFGLSTREAKAVTAELVPATAVPLRAVVTTIRPAVGSVSAPADPGEPVRPTCAATDSAPPVRPASDATALGQAVGQTNRVASASPPPSGPVLVEEPLTAELSRIHVTVPRTFMKKLDAARAALSHSRPGATEEEVLALGLDLILQRHAKRRGLVEKPRVERAEPPTPAADAPEANLPPSRAAPGRVGSRSPRREPVPAHVKRAVWRRDAGRCQWPLQGGGVCGSTLRVQLDHVVPVALGGKPTVDNLRCLCAAHNQRAAREVFGDAHMDRFTARFRAT